MTIQDIKLIACDMDGTLLTTDKKVSPRTAAAVRKAIDAGKMFILATGRMFIAAKPFADQLGLDVPIVVYNGGLIKGSKSEKVFLEQPVPQAIAQEMLDFIKGKDIYMNFYVGDKIYIEKECDKSRAYGKVQNLTDAFVVVGEDFYTAQGSPYKMLLSMEAERLHKLLPVLKEKFKGKLHIFDSNYIYVEITALGVNKWQAIQKLAESYGIKQEEIMCIGDTGNDTEMVANAGLGVAMANGEDCVKNVAKMITASNDNDGVALAIESILTPQANE